MSLKIKQTVGLYVGRGKSDRWKWAVCLVGKEVKHVSHVTWELHKSQPKTSVTSRNAEGKFQCSGITNGWFEVKCVVMMKNNTTHVPKPLNLALYYPDHIELAVRG